MACAGEIGDGREANVVLVPPPSPPTMSKHFREAGKHEHYDARFYGGEVEPALAKKVLLELLGAFGDAVRPLGLAPVLMHGALIGWAWNRRLLPWDRDIDLCVALDELAALDREAAALDYDRARFVLDVNPNYVDPATRNRHPRETIEENKIDARFVDRATGLYLDVTALRPVPAAGDGEARVATKCPHSYRVADLMPLQASELEGVPVHVPRDVEAVLVQEYGERVLTRRVFRGWRFDEARNAWVEGSELQRFFERLTGGG